MSYEDVDYYTTSEKKWKKYKKESYTSNNSNKSPTFPRSYSQKTSSNKASSSSLPRSSSVRSPTSPNNNSPSSSRNEGKSTLMGGLSKKSSAFGKKCTNLAKEQKAKFYIVKRCVSMLVSSRKNNGDS